MTTSPNDRRKDDAMSCLWLPTEATHPDTIPLLGNPPSPLKLREQLGMTPDEFAEMIGVATTKLRDWEEGRAEPDVHDRRVIYAVLRTAAAVARKAMHRLPAQPPTPETIIEAPDRSRRMSVSDAGGVLVSVTLEERKTLRDSEKFDDAFATDASGGTWFKLGEFAQILVCLASKLEEIRDESERIRAKRSYVALAILIAQLACEPLFGRTFGLFLARASTALKDLDEGRRNPLLTPPPRPVDKRTGRPKGGTPATNIPENTHKMAVAACAVVIAEKNKCSKISACNTVSKMTKKAFGRKVSPSTIRGWIDEAESDRAHFAMFIAAARRDAETYRPSFTETALKARLNKFANIA